MSTGLGAIEATAGAGEAALTPMGETNVESEDSTPATRKNDFAFWRLLRYDLAKARTSSFS